MEFLGNILENPIYLILFGSGGVLVIFIAVLAFKKRDSNSDKNIHIGININNQNSPSDEIIPEYNLKIDGVPEIDSSDEYQELDFHSDEYIITFLKTIEEKKKVRDDIKYE